MTNQQNTHPVPAVRAIIENGSGKILLLRRANTASGNGAWCLPGGKIDYGQTAEQAVIREVAEETGLQVTDAQFFMYQDSLPPSPGEMHCINLYFKCLCTKTVHLNAESSEHIWADAHALENLKIVFGNKDAAALYLKMATHSIDNSESIYNQNNG